MLRNHGIRIGVVVAMCGLLSGCGSDSPPPPSAGYQPTLPPPRVTPSPTPQPNAQPGIILRPVPETVPTPGVNREGESVTQALAIPTGDKATSVLLLEKTFPAQARLGKVYRYELKVTNLTDHPLAGVVVRERLPDDFRVARGQPEPATQPADPNAPATLPSRPITGVDSRDGQAVQQFVVGDLSPHESKTIPITGIAGRLGRLATLTSATYTPQLAAGTEVINPILRLSKEGPATADLCGEVLWRYIVSNVGTGTETNVVIDEALPEGLIAADGRRTVKIEVGSLPEGQSKDFTVHLKAAKVGKYAGSATARGTGTETASQEIATVVQAPKLAVAVTGPETEYVGKTAAYDLVITNNGDAPARDTSVVASADNGAQLVFFAGIQADPANAAAATQQSLGVIEPGESKKARVAFRPVQGGPMNISVTARAACADPASNQAKTNVQTIAALVIEVSQRDDLVRVGENTLYTIRVKNQGSGPDRNVAIVATLPAQLEFVRATGTTEAKQEGQKVIFTPQSSLAPGEFATWTVEAKAAKAADIRFRVELTSESLTEPTLATQPTKLY